MVVKLQQPNDVIVNAQKLYPKEFHKVAESSYMDDMYIKSALMSGVREYVKTSKDVVNIADIAGGSGRQGRIIKKLVGENSEKVVVHEIDISRTELGKGRGNDKIIGDVMHLPLSDNSMDFVFMNNVPQPLFQVRNYIISMEGDTGKKKAALKVLDDAIDAQYSLLLLEAGRVLKKNGVMMLGAKQPGQSREDIQKDMAGLSLKLEKLEVVELEDGVVPLWRKYGVEIEKPRFGIALLRKEGGDTKEATELYEKRFKASLKELMEIPGSEEGRSMIEEVFEKMKRAQMMKPGKTFKIQPGDVRSFDVGGHEPEPDWMPF
jgi:SAM-dependent methyltransferase